MHVSDEEKTIIGKTEILGDKPDGWPEGSILLAKDEETFDLQLSNGVFVRTKRQVPVILRLVEKSGKIWTVGAHWPLPVPGYKVRADEKAPIAEWDFPPKDPKGKLTDPNFWAFDVGHIFYDEPKKLYRIFAFPRGTMIDPVSGQIRLTTIEDPKTDGWKYDTLVPNCWPRATLAEDQRASIEEAVHLTEFANLVNLQRRETFEQFLDESGDVERSRPDDKEEEDDTIVCPYDDCEEASVPPEAKFCQTCGRTMAKPAE